MGLIISWQLYSRWATYNENTSSSCTLHFKSTNDLLLEIEKIWKVYFHTTIDLLLEIETPNLRVTIEDFAIAGDREKTGGQFATIISIKHDLARSCFKFWLKVGDEGDKISRKKTGEANYDSERGIFNWILSHSGLWTRYGPYFSLCIERRSLKTGKQLVIFTFLRLSPPCASSG